MKAEILSTGDEIVSGGVTDTNSTWLATKLLTMGIATQRCVAVGDDLAGIARAIVEAAGRADLLLVTGGLGPTSDDLTAEAAARAGGVESIMNPEALGSMERFFAKRGWDMAEANRKQARLPKGAGVIENCAGTAPGFYLVLSGCHCFFMPGVPSEMKVMARKKVFPRIQKIFGLPGVIASRSITVFGLPESEVGARLHDFNLRFPGVRLGFRVDFPLIEVKLSCGDSKGEGGETVLDGAVGFVESILGRRVVSIQGLTMEQEVGRLLLEAGATVAAAESCTGGLVASMLTDVSGSSGYFLFSGVTYSNDAKVRVLGVKEATLEGFGAVSEETAGEMARGVRNLTGATYGISTSGIAGPGGGSDEKPVGTVCVGVAGPGFSWAKRYVFPFDDRTMNKKMFAVTALEMLRRRLNPKEGTL
ncbi:MAG: CinA family nicotinamide mononucleotide deamidase-related protein [Desulfobacteraceae bacterium]|nr:CinA family nicotinamide mononucleotide deamidase-related protein [Desulfobacteraceae bacterium]